jgi:hypothetical protein
MMTLTRSGRLGHARPYEFLSGETVIRYLMDEEPEVSLTVGLEFRDPKKYDLSWDDAIRWIEKNSKNVYEAWAEKEDRLHVQAIANG